MEKAERKAAADAYKDRKVAAGIYVIRCLASGEAWVGQTADVSKIENRVRFSLKQGTHPHGSLKAALMRHGADAFTFEVVEALDIEESYARAEALKARQAHWLAQLAGTPI
jgi:hypothetical protein